MWQTFLSPLAHWFIRPLNHHHLATNQAYLQTPLHKSPVIPQLKPALQTSPQGMSYTNNCNFIRWPRFTGTTTTWTVQFIVHLHVHVHLFKGYCHFTCVLNFIGVWQQTIFNEFALTLKIKVICHLAWNLFETALLSIVNSIFITTEPSLLNKLHVHVWKWKSKIYSFIHLICVLGHIWEYSKIMTATKSMVGGNKQCSRKTHDHLQAAGKTSHLWLGRMPAWAGESNRLWILDTLLVLRSSTSILTE